MNPTNNNTSSHATLAIVWMLVAVCLFSIMDAVMKGLTDHFPSMQIAALRGWSSVPLLLLWMLATGNLHRLKPVNWKLHVLRGALGIFMLSTFAYGLKELSLADTYTLFFVAPILITVFASFTLNENVGRARWIAIVVGMLGVLVVLRPTGEGLMSLGALAVLGAAVAYAVGAITVRVLARTDSMQAVMFWMIATVAVGATLLTGNHWRDVTWAHAPALLGLGISGTLGQYALTRAFQLGEASAIAPFEYTALAFGIAIDWWFWNTLPDHYVYLGAAIIIGSGVYLVRAERQHVSAEHP